MFIARYDNSWLLKLSSIDSCIQLPTLYETLPESVSSNSFKFSEFNSEMSSEFGDSGGVLYSCEVVLLFSEYSDVGLFDGESCCC